MAFLRRREVPVLAPSTLEERSYACAFCGEGIEAKGRDPLLLNIVERFAGGCEVDSFPSSSIYAHAQCLLERLEPDMREHMAEDLAS